VWGTIHSANRIFSFELVVRSLSGKELFRLPYQEEAAPLFEGFFPPGANSTGRIFYFPLFDGVTFPKCLSCPNPYYPESERRDRVSGTVLASVLITSEGKTDQVHLLKRLSRDLDNRSLEAIKSWRFEPAKGPDGTPVPVRIQSEVTFRLY
jgi:periplasmic protein TonB